MISLGSVGPIGISKDESAIAPKRKRAYHIAGCVLLCKEDWMVLASSDPTSSRFKTYKNYLISHTLIRDILRQLV